MSTIFLLKSTRVFHRSLINEGIFKFKLLFMNNRLLFSYCFLDGGEQSHDGDISPLPLLYKNPVHFTCIFENVCQISVYEPQCNCMAFVIDVLFSITDSRSLTSQKDLRTQAYVVASFSTQMFHYTSSYGLLWSYGLQT